MAMAMTMAYAQQPSSKRKMPATVSTLKSAKSALANAKQTALRFSDAKAFMKTSAQRVAKVDENSDFITEQPEGEEITLVKSASYYTVDWGECYLDENKGGVATIVKGTDGYYYMKDPFSGLTTYSWLKLEKEDENTLVAKLPQKIDAQYTTTEAGADTTIYAYAEAMNLVTSTVDGQEQQTYAATENQEYKFIIKGDSIVCADPELLLGMGTDKGTWYGYGDYNIRMGVFADQPVKVDEETASKALDFSLEYTDYVNHRFGYVVKGAFANDGSVYVKGVFQEFPDAWIKGTFDGTKAVFKSGQYVGYNSKYACFSYFDAATTATEKDEDGEEYLVYVLADEIAFDVDLTTMTMTTDRNFLLNTNKNDKVDYICARYQPIIKSYSEQPGTPQNPQFVKYSAYNDEDEYGYANVYIPIFDTNGHLMNSDKVYYNYYIDGEKVTFKPGQYFLLDEEITDLPYYFRDTQLYNGDIFTSDALHTCYIYFTGYERFGVQTTYTGGGEEHSSEIIYYQDPSAINALQSDINATIKNVVYHDLAGRAISKPNKGLYISTIIYSDGTTKSVKSIK